MIKKIKTRFSYRFRNYKNKIYRLFKSHLLKNKEVTIISNNCWGGTFYNLHKNRFNSPTINLFFMAEDYLEFVKNIKYYLSLEL